MTKIILNSVFILCITGSLAYIFIIALDKRVLTDAQHNKQVHAWCLAWGILCYSTLDFTMINLGYPISLSLPISVFYGVFGYKLVYYFITLPLKKPMTNKGSGKGVVTTRKKKNKYQNQVYHVLAQLKSRLTSESEKLTKKTGTILVLIIIIIIYSYLGEHLFVIENSMLRFLTVIITFIFIVAGVCSLIKLLQLKRALKTIIRAMADKRDTLPPLPEDIPEDGNDD